MRTRKVLSLAVFAAISAGTASSAMAQATEQATTQQQAIEQAVAAGRPIDMVIVLDTSGSMSDLIDSARGRIWSIVLKLAEAEPTPALRIGLLTYGTPEGALEEDGWIKKQIDLTGEIDDAYTKMMALGTEGGDEFVGWALHKALRNMDWSQDKDALRLIYIAGNESANQAAEVHNFRDVAREAEGRDIVVNALYGGAPASGVAESWDKVPSGNGGEYFAIDMAAGTVQVATPFDTELERLNNQLNATLIPFGKDGTQKFKDVLANDAGANQLGWNTNSTRIAAKACVLWCNSSWDLVDACATAEFKLEDVAEEDLPEFLRPMSVEQRQTFVAAMKEAREAVHAKIAAVNASREAYIQKYRSLTAGTEQESLDEAIMSSLARQAKAKGFVIELPQPVSTPAAVEELTPQEDIIFELAVDRLMWNLPRMQYEIGPFRTVEKDVAEKFAATTGLDTSYIVDGQTFGKREDAEAGLRTATIRKAGRLMQVETVERELEDQSTLTEFHIAGQVLANEEAAQRVAAAVNQAMDNAEVASTLEEVAQQARKMFAAALKARANLQGE